MRKIRIAQASPTMIHANLYRDTLLLMPDEYELVGFYDRDPESVRNTLNPEVQHVPIFPTLAELLQKAKPEVVMVSTYLKDMPSWMLQVAESKANVWAEKPFAVHSTQLFSVAETIKSKKPHFSCCYSWRFNPIAKIIKETYDAGILGKPYSIEIRFLTSSVERRNPETWFMKREQSGGGILNWLGCHWFDLMRFITSAEVRKVSAIEANVSGQLIDVEDAASVSLQFDNGMIGSLHAGYFTPGDGEISIGLRGSLGWAKWEEVENSVTIKSTHPAWQSAPLRKFYVATEKIGGYGAEGRALMQAFAAAIRGEGSSGYSVEDAIRSLQIIEGAHNSAQTGQTVVL